MEAAAAAATVADVGSKFAKPVVDSIWRQISYVWNYSNNTQALKTEVRKLRERREAVQHQVDEAIRNAEAIENEVKHWLETANETIVAAENILEDNDAAKQTCFMGCRPSLKSRHQLSREATKKTLVIEEVRGDENFRRISYRPPLDMAPATDYEAFESRSATFDHILEALKNADVNMVGVYGMGGVGKTTLANKVAERLREKENVTFKAVVMSTITKTVDLERIQNEIADVLGLKLDEKTTTGRAARLRSRLKQEENFLVILDDIWDTVNLKEIGIPFGDDHKGSKLLMTSRDLTVLQRMGLERRNCFRLNVLKDEEAKELFEKKAGPLDSPEIRDIASEVAERCAGLPVLIVTVATALKGRESFKWKDAVERLKDNELDKKVQSGLELSYESLENEEIKSLFLLCGQLLAYSDRIKELLKYVVGLRLFNNCRTLEKTRNRLYAYLDDLKSCCFLEEGTEEEVKMHDVILDFALKYNHVFAVADGKVSNWPPRNELEQCTAIYLNDVTFNELPSKLECPYLRTFHLKLKYFQFRFGSLKIPDDLFGATHELRLLDLKYLSLSRLPSSLENLENLQTLCLEDCKLGDISLIGKLKNLQVLSLVDSKIVALPRELEELTSLQLLDLTHCSNLKVVPPNVLSKLIQLEELRMGNNFKQWEGEGEDEQRKNASLSELRYLSKLATLDIQISDVSILRRDFFSEKLESFRIFLGDKWNSFDWLDMHKKRKVMKLQLNTCIQLEEIKGPLQKAEELYLYESKGVRSLCNMFEDEGFPELKHLRIQNNLDIEYIIDWPRMTAFPRLESLYLINLKNLEMIYHGQFVMGSFSKLRVLEVVQCDQLKNLFSFTVLKALVQVETIKITDCQILKEIVAVEDFENVETIQLPQLQRLYLENLPRLTSFCAGKLIECPSLKEFRIKDCPLLQEFVLSSSTKSTIFTQKIQLPNLESLSGVKGSFTKLRILKIENIDRLKNLFSFSILKGLVQLEEIYVSDCQVLKEIIGTETREGSVSVETIQLPSLKKLDLINLPQLTRFCTGKLIECPSLKVVEIDNCPLLQEFISNSTMTRAGEANSALFDEKVLFPNLNRLSISRMEKLEKIWDDELHEDSFCQLERLTVKEGKALLKVFPSKQLRRFKSIEILEIEDCELIEEVFDMEVLMETHEQIPSQLGDLYLRKLPCLQNVWKRDPRGNLSFCNLRKIFAWNCSRLKYLFPFSIAQSLPELSWLSIDNCALLEGIVSKGESVDANPVFEYFQFWSLDLENVPELKYFYPEEHILKCQDKESLVVELTSKFGYLQITYEESSVSTLVYLKNERSSVSI